MVEAWMLGRGGLGCLRCTTQISAPARRESEPSDQIHPAGGGDVLTAQSASGREDSST